MVSAAPVSRAPALPAEIVCQIIERTGDTHTLDSWCAATASALALHRVALRTRWASAEMTQDDFICPVDDSGASSPIASSPQSPGSLIRKTVYADDNPANPLPASFIKHLFLNFQIQRPDEIKDQNTGYQVYDEEQLPTKFYHDGVLHQENLDEILKLVQTPIRTLRIRTTASKYPCRWLHPQPPYELYEMVDGLRRLEVCRVWQGEGASLAKAIEVLENLEILAVVAAVPSDYEIHNVEEVSALNEFLAHIFPIDDKEAENGCKLPRGLKSLILSDPNQRNVLMHKRTNSVARGLFPNLTDLYLDFENVSALARVFDWLDLPVLGQLTLPVPCTVMEARASGVWHEAYAAMTELMQSVIGRHMNTPRQITVLNAWQETDIRLARLRSLQVLNANWDSTFTPQELVLGTKPKSLNPMNYPDSPDGHVEMRDLCNLIITLIQQNSYGSSLRRLRIDQMDFYQDVLDEFLAQLGCDKIKILMLYPWPRTTSFPEPQLPCDLRTFREGRVAMNVVVQDLPELRILVLGGYQFWIDRSPLDTKEVDAALSPSLPNLRLWHFSQAEKDPLQSIDIKRWVTGRDRYFMATWPPHPRAQDSSACSWKDEDSNCLSDEKTMCTDAKA